MSREIERLLARFLSDAAQPDWVRAKATRWGALPLVLDMGGCYALRAGGEIISFGWDFAARQEWSASALEDWSTLGS
jgi:hypothetical protein